MRKMHKFLKILILIILLWALTLPWTFSYLSTITSLQEIERNLLLPSQLQRRQKSFESGKVVLGIVACGDKAVNQSVVLIKSILMSSLYFGLETIETIIFADDDHLHAIDLKVQALKRSTRGIKFRYEIHPVIFPARNHDEWRDLFKPCASQRLFLHSALPHINEILYLDVDTLVVGDLRQIWSKFQNMGSEQVVGLVQETEIASIGWYNRFARHPYYPPYGLNTGVMLMNLTRLRNQSNFDWENAILQNFKDYKDNITFGDQDLINIVFHYRPDMVYILDCKFNYRTDHCRYGLNCKFPPASAGIQIIHGSRSVFFDKDDFPLFAVLYQQFEKLNMEMGSLIRDVVIPFRKETLKYEVTNPGKITPNCDNIGHLLFPFFDHHNISNDTKSLF